MENNNCFEMDAKAPKLLNTEIKTSLSLGIHFAEF